MIVEALVKLLRGVIGLVFDLFGTFPAPSWVSSTASSLQSVVDMAASMGTWVPWSTITTVAAAVFAAAVLSLGIRVARMVLSLFTGGGGSAA